MIELSSGRCSASIDPHTGGRLRSLAVAGRELIADFSDDVGGEHESWYGGSFPLAPWAGRIPGGAVLIDGADIRLPVDSTDNATHGQVTNREWSVDKRDTSSAVLSLGIESPWPAVLSQRFELSDRALIMTLSLRALAAMPCVLGFHPWFAREPDGSLPRIDFRPATRVITATSLSDHDTETDELAVVPRDYLYRGVRIPPRVRWSDGTVITLRSDSPIWVIYERSPQGFCLEPWTGTPHDFATAAVRLEPGETRSLALTIEWGDEAHSASGAMRREVGTALAD